MPPDGRLDDVRSMSGRSASTISLHAADAAAALGNGVEIVADRLFTRKVAERTEDGAEEAGQAAYDRSCHRGRAARSAGSRPWPGDGWI